MTLISLVGSLVSLLGINIMSTKVRDVESMIISPAYMPIQKNYGTIIAGILFHHIQDYDREAYIHYISGNRFISSDLDTTKKYVLTLRRNYLLTGNFLLLGGLIISLIDLYYSAPVSWYLALKKFFKRI